jgi:LPS-assembly lipoprotein
MWWSSLYRTLFLIGFLTLAGCGFRLQGTGTLPPEMATTYIDTGNRYSLFYRALRTDLQSRGVEVTKKRSEATAVIHVIEDTSTNRVVAVSLRNVPEEYEILYTVRYSVSMGGKEALPLRRQTLTRSYTYDETEVLGKEIEEKQLRAALASDLARQLMVQASRL